MLLFQEANSILVELFNNLAVLFQAINWDVIFFAGLAFEILFAVFYLIKSRFSYESRVVKKLLKLNNWLNKNRNIDQSNLIEFNNMMKKTPKHLRYYWHEYMLNREKEPSYYMSTYNLVEKPLKSSSYKSNLKNFKITTILMASFITLFSLLKLSVTAQVNEMFFGVVAQCLLTPALMLLFYGILSMIMRASQNMNISALYQYVHYFGRFLDRAVTTMPDYVDFEVLFTRREIKKGIPVLNEYLEKRARQEQEELEKARMNAVEHETYDFSSTGINGSLVLERAINESETFINIRSRLLSEIQQIEDEMESIKRTYENTEKDYQKKMQVSKENVDRLRKQQEETTNRIENNYIKKQQADEIKKQEQLEKDNDAATIRFNQEIQSLTVEIETRRKELEERRQHVEDAMKAEYQTFSTKLYKSLSTILQEENEDEKAELIEIKDEIASSLQEANDLVAQKDREITELKRLLDAYNIDVNAHLGYSSEKLARESKKKKDKKKVKENKQDLALEQSNQTQAEMMAKLAPTANFAQDPKLIPLSQIKEEDRQYGEDGGFYDPNGYYRYPNGTYFTPNSEFHDEFGGWYEADAITYHEPTPEIIEAALSAPKQNMAGLKRMAEIPENQRQYSEDGGFFDNDGYYYYPNGTYFTPDGRFFDEFGGWFEADGVTYHAPRSEDEDNALEQYSDAQDEDVYVLNQKGAIQGKEFEENRQQELSAEAKKEISKLRNDFNIEVEREKARAEVQETTEDDEESEEKIESPVQEIPAKVEEISETVEDEPVEFKEITETQKQESHPIEEVFEEPQEPEEEIVEVKVQEKPQPKQEKVEIFGAVEDMPQTSKEDLFVMEQIQEVEEPVSTFEEEQPPKRKAGRPRKYPVQEKEQSSEPKRGRGRPRKIVSAEELEEVSLAQEPSQPKRGRGRPRKTQTEEVALSVEEPQKKQRGRPKKEVDVERTENVEKRGRGRPKKSVATQPKKETNIKEPKIYGGDASGSFDGLMTTEVNPELEELDALNERIANENKRLAEHQEEFNNQINETLFQLSSDDEEDK